MMRPASTVLPRLTSSAINKFTRGVRQEKKLIGIKADAREMGTGRVVCPRP